MPAAWFSVDSAGHVADFCVGTQDTEQLALEAAVRNGRDPQHLRALVNMARKVLRLSSCHPACLYHLVALTRAGALSSQR